MPSTSAFRPEFDALQARGGAHGRRGQHENNAFQACCRPLDQAPPIGFCDGGVGALLGASFTNHRLVGNLPHTRSQAGQAGHDRVQRVTGVDALAYELVQAFQVGDHSVQFTLYSRRLLMILRGSVKVRNAAGEPRHPAIQLIGDGLPPHLRVGKRNLRRRGDQGLTQFRQLRGGDQGG